MTDDLVDIFKIFITTRDPKIAEEVFEFMLAHFSAQNKDTTYFIKLKNNYFDYSFGEIIGIRSALKVEFENLSGLKVH